MKKFAEELAEIKDDELTGRYYHRQLLLHPGLILMVEYKYTMDVENNRLPMTKWRMATHHDIEKLGLITQ